MYSLENLLSWQRYLLCLFPLSGTSCPSTWPLLIQKPKNNFSCKWKGVQIWITSISWASCTDLFNNKFINKHWNSYIDYYEGKKFVSQDIIVNATDLKGGGITKFLDMILEWCSDTRPCTFSLMQTNSNALVTTLSNSPVHHFPQISFSTIPLHQWVCHWLTSSQKPVWHNPFSISAWF